MAYQIAICDDSDKDAAFVQEILTQWAQDRQIEILARGFPSAESFLFE